jgi:hypothetical protein
MEIARRRGTPPVLRCSTNVTCPDVFELVDGSFAVMGRDATVQLDDKLSAVEAARAADERIVVLPREVMLDALRDLQREIRT